MIKVLNIIQINITHLAAGSAVVRACIFISLKMFAERVFVRVLEMVQFFYIGDRKGKK